MTPRRLIIAALALALPVLGAGAARAPDPAPVVVELFTAQGCEGCPQANALAAQLAQRPGLLVLTYGVDYWDYLGWEDTFARPAFAERQQAYRAALRQRDVYTPQMIFNGRRQAPGVRAEAVDEALAEAAGDPAGPRAWLLPDGARAAVGSGRAPAGGADVWLVRYQAEVEPVLVRSGENRGVSVPFANVVREIADVGDWRGRAGSFPLPEAEEDGLSTLILVQARRTGEILAVSRPEA